MCGRSSAERGEVEWACAIEAWSAGTPVVLRSSSQGIDSVIQQAWVYDGTHIWMLSQDQFDDPPWDVDGYECVDPVVLTDDDEGYEFIDCGSVEPDGTHYQVCGEICAECGEPDPLPFPVEDTG